MIRFMRRVPVPMAEGGEFTLRIDGLGYAEFYRRTLLAEGDFAGSLPEKIEERTLAEAEAFVYSSDYKNGPLLPK